MHNDQEPTPSPTPIWMVLLGWIFTLLASAQLTVSALSKLMKPAEVANMFKTTEAELAKGMEKLAWPADVVHALAFVELGCVILYFFPRTAVLGAILLTGYLGGAVAAHVRVYDQFWIPFVVAAVVWLGIYFRDDRVRALVPWRRLPSGSPPTGGFVGVVKPIFTTVAAAVIVVVGLAIVLAAFAATRPDEYEVTRSITIDAPPSEVFKQVNNFSNWNSWNPWSKPDPDIKLTLEGPPEGKGAVYKWVGNEHVGEGKMTITESKPDELVRIKLDFIKPMEDTAEVEFTFKADGNKTLATWKMYGTRNLGFKMLTTALNMDKIIADKHDEGLASIKAIVEAREPERKRP